MGKQCTVSGCSKKLAAKGLCAAHYWRMNKYGTVDSPPLKRPAEEKFFAQIAKDGDDGCWQWLGKTSSDGYGKFRFKGGQLAHRYSYFLHNGDLPSYVDKNGVFIVIMHSCNNKGCVNPRHLSIGTQKENVRDAARDGLLRRSRSGGKRLLNAETAFNILKEDGRYKDIADKYGCSRDTVGQIKIGKRWDNAIEEFIRNDNNNNK